MKYLSTCIFIGAVIVLAAFAGAAMAADSGQAGFERVCAACHLPSGEGMPGVFPPVKNSDYFKKATPAQLIKLLDNGLSGPIVVNGQKYNSAMPPQGLSDEDAANVLNYVSAALNGGKPAFTAEQVKRLRAAK
ncbi:cytochrome c [Uliginosibacterium sp. H3]|uniref:Cytochrome c n=1 Tax=Uliginosibacterium silvisoli TaxID=3114758 RepID=A0ABU6K639_9RHOO|nr:cytochrome c [Uliginosibacterium sp. H3]